MSGNAYLRRAQRLATTVAILSVSLMLGGIALLIRFGEPEIYELLVALVIGLDATICLVLAILIIVRAGNNTVGWLFLLLGASAALWFLATGLAVMAEGVPITSEVLLGWIRLFSELVYLPLLILPPTLVLIYFPDGKLLSRRWRMVVFLALYGLLGWAAVKTLAPWPNAVVDSNLVNPLAIPGSERFFDVLSATFGPAFGLATLGSVAGVVVRFRRSRGVERQQMKWLTYTAAVSVAITTLLLALGEDGGVLGSLNGLVMLSLPGFFALAIGAAILRYRLFDIDLVIRRTLQYGLLTGVLALLYFGLVVASQDLLLAGGSEQNGIAIVLSTLAVAALFNPLRIRLQQAIDRRFYRQKYEAERVLASFAATARDEVNLEQLREALTGVVQGTVQPSTVTVVLRADWEGSEPRVADA